MQNIKMKVSHQNHPNTNFPEKKKREARPGAGLAFIAFPKMATN